MKEIFDASDLLISRAGATILAEIAVCKKPAILVPYPHATDNHQEKNAKVLEKLNAAKMLRDDELSLETISKLLTELQDKEKLKKMGIAMANSRPSNVESKILEELSVLLDF
ncbi:MAG: UDP-N-acetylglucosamine--N-acetylmuramyl-(pentapeptide) pyrophosphoryl-undecaprenol N-acetylglucosamine transferase [bacterium ADurb.Bin157]|nr:MAG: UDP-N-acetylglucosamine--N-acetylmuramyl-(pentapeptide) pyrophosphoryl-undecaprenol N-acetylglucosamine transferase [bacterium ADurb.Bin157]